MDVLVPKIGEIIGGSQREDDLEVLTRRMGEMGVPSKGLEWYLELRKYGTCPHAGFGLGFERLIMYVTGIENIRDVIPFPRWPGNAGELFVCGKCPLAVLYARARAAHCLRQHLTTPLAPAPRTHRTTRVHAAM